MPRRKAKQNGKTPFSLRLQALRKARKLNMEKLAQAVGVSKSFVSLLESGGRQPSRDVVLELAKALTPDATTEGTAFEKLRDELLVLAGFMPVNPAAVQTFQDTLSLYAKAVAENPTDFRLFSRWVMALIRSGHYEEARQRIDEGMKTFSQAAYLCALRAQLELSQQHYGKALEQQRQAVIAAEQDSDDSSLDLSDLRFNVSAILFLMGHQHMQENPAKALEYFVSAIEGLEPLLDTADAYVLDEYARLLFNRAYLTGETAHWEQTIAAYRQVLIHPEKSQLGVTALKESAAFLAHAYTKMSDFDAAELTLGLLSAFQQEDWLVNYLQACLYTAMAEHTPQNTDTLLERALTALRASHATHPERTRSEALHDPDLNYLRQHKDLFEEINP